MPNCRRRLQRHDPEVLMANANHSQAQRPRLPLELLPDTLAICRLEPTAPPPGWAQ